MQRPTAPLRRTLISCCAFLSPSPLNSLRALDAFLCVAPILHSLLCCQFLECLTDRKAEGMNRLDQLCRNVLRFRGDECLQLRRDLLLQLVFNEPAPPEIYTLSPPDALPIWRAPPPRL